MRSDRSKRRRARLLAGLPLIERPIESKGDTFVVMLSGDGGWSTLTEKVATELNANGVPVVGWNMLKYFWSAKTPGARRRGSGDDHRLLRQALAQRQS